MRKRVFIVQAKWDEEARVWWGRNDAIPLTTEAKTFDALVRRVMKIAPELIALNRVAKAGDTVTIRVVAERGADVSLSAA
jgi:hypothetical protein